MSTEQNNTDPIVVENYNGFNIRKRHIPKVMDGYYAEHVKGGFQWATLTTVEECKKIIDTFWSEQVERMMNDPLEKMRRAVTDLGNIYGHQEVAKAALANAEQEREFLEANRRDRA